MSKIMRNELEETTNDEQIVEVNCTEEDANQLMNQTYALGRRTSDENGVNSVRVTIMEYSKETNKVKLKIEKQYDELNV